MARRAAGLVLLLVLVLAAAGCGGGASGGDDPGRFRGLVLEDRPVAANFRLRDQDGRPVSLADQRGRWVLMTFLYTWCPDVCPVIAGNLNQALRSAPAKQAGVSRAGSTLTESTRRPACFAGAERSAWFRFPAITGQTSGHHV